MENLHVQLRLRRLALGLTQKTVAASAGVGTRTLVAFENGEAGISLANLRRLMSVVGLELTTREASPRPTLDELFERYPGTEPQTTRKRAPKRSKPT